MTAIAREDGSIATLSAAALQTCIAGGFKILKDVPHHTYSWVRVTWVSADCPIDTCIDVTREICVALWSSANPAIGFVDIEDVGSFKKLCSECAKEAREQHTVGRQRMWDKLPVYFGWSSWNDVLK